MTRVPKFIQHMSDFMKWVRSIEQITLIILVLTLIEMLRFLYLQGIDFILDVTKLIDSMATASLSFLFLLLVLPLLVIAILFCYMMEKMDQVQKAINPHIEFIANDELGPNGPDKLFDATKKIVKNAKREIFALNSFIKEDFNRNEGDHRQDYFKTLIEKSKEVDYVRIIQLDENSHLCEYYHRTYITHFEDMINQISAPGREKNIELLRVSPQYPSTFMIVDDEWLIYQLNILTDPANPGAPANGLNRQYQMRGILIVHDPQHIFIEHFRTTFKELRNRARKLLEGYEISGTPFK